MGSVSQSVLDILRLPSVSHTPHAEQPRMMRMYLLFPAWLLGISQVHGCLEFVVGAGAFGGRISQQECAFKCANDPVCSEWTYNLAARSCFMKPNLDKPKVPYWNFEANLDVNLWVTGTKQCVGCIPGYKILPGQHECCSEKEDWKMENGKRIVTERRRCCHNLAANGAIMGDNWSSTTKISVTCTI